MEIKKYVFSTTRAQYRTSHYRTEFSAADYCPAMIDAIYIKETEPLRISTDLKRSYEQSTIMVRIICNMHPVLVSASSYPWSIKTVATPTLPCTARTFSHGFFNEYTGTPGSRLPKLHVDLEYGLVLIYGLKMRTLCGGLDLGNVAILANLFGGVVMLAVQWSKI